MSTTEKHVGGLELTKTQAELAAGLKDFLTKAPPDGKGIDAAKISNIVVKVHPDGKPKGFAFFDAEDSIAASVDVTGMDIPGLGKITIKNSTGKKIGGATTSPTPAPTPTPAPVAPAPTPTPATPATPAAPARRTTTPRTTATRTTATRASGTKVWLIIVLGLLALAVIAAAIVLPLTIGGKTTEDPVARQGLREVNARVDNLSEVTNQTNTIVKDIQEALRSKQEPPALAPAPVPVPPAPMLVPAPAPNHHPVDNGARPRPPSRLDDMEADWRTAIAAERAERIAADAALRTDLQAETAERKAVDAEQARIDQILTNWNGADTCRRSDARSRQGCQYLEQELGRQFE